MNLFDLMASISLDTGEYDRGISSVESGANSAQRSLDSMDTGSVEKGLDSVGDAADSAGSDLNSMGSDADSAGNDLKDLGDDADSAGDDLESMGSDANNAGSDLSSLGSDANSAGSDLSGLGSDAADAGSDLSGLGSDADSAGSDLSGLGSDADSLGSDLDSMGADADDAGGDLSDLGSEADDAGSDLDDMASSADDLAGSLDDLGGSASGAAGELGSLGTEFGGTIVSGSDAASEAVGGLSNIVSGFATGGLVGGITTACATIGTGIYNMATETQDASATIAQATGATGDELEDMTNRAKSALSDVKLASDTNLNAVAATLGEVSTRLGYTGDDLQTTTTLMEDFAAITGQSGVQAVDGIADVMAKWNLESEDMPGLLDQITAASQASGASAEDLTTQLANNSTAFEELGMSTEDALAFMGAYEQAGGNASDMSSILKTAVNNLNGEVDDMPAAFNDAIAAIQNSEDATSALNAEVGDTGLTVEDVFGTKMANKIIGACQSSQFSLEEMQDTLENCDGALEQTADASVTFADKVSGAFNSFKEGCSNVWQTVKGWFSNTKDASDEAVEGLVNGLESGESEVESAAEDLGEAVIDGVNDTLETHSPSRVMQSTGEDVTEGLANGMDGMGSRIGGILSGVMSNITSFGSEATSSASETGTGFVSNIKNGLSNLVDTVTSPLKSVTSETDSWGSENTRTADETAREFVSNTNSGLSGIGDTVSTQLDKATKQVGSWQDMMKTKSTAIGTTFMNNFINAMSPLSSKVREALNNIYNTANSYSSYMSNSGQVLGNNLIVGMINGLNSRSSSLYSTISSIVNNAVARANSAAGTHSPSTKLMWTGQMMDEGLAVGLDRYADVAENAMEDMIEGVIDSADAGDISLGNVTMDSQATLNEQMSAFNNNFEKLFTILGQYLPLIGQMQMVLDTGAFVGEILPDVDKGLGKLNRQRARQGA